MDEKEEAMKKQLTEAQRRENVLVLRLSAREQELQDVAAVAVNYKKLQVSMIFVANINWLAPELPLSKSFRHKHQL